MYLARFSYHILPVNRHRALELISREVKVELKKLGELDQFRRGAGTKVDTGKWMQRFSEILVAPPEVEILRVEAD
jgi:hypothetical protein